MDHISDNYSWFSERFQNYEISLFMFILTAARQQPVSLLANFSIVLGILWRKYGICGRGISDQNFFSIPRLKSKVWSGNILCIYGHMWSWSFFLFRFCRSGGIPAAAFDAGINPKFLNRVQLVPLFKSHFIQCYRLTLSSYYWWCRYKSYLVIAPAQFL